MTRWLKLSEGFWTARKIVNAGPYGGLVYQALLDLNSIGNCDGVIPGATVKAILARLPGLGLTAARVKQGIDACRTEALIACDPGDTIRLVGWDDSWRPAVTGAERTERYRQKRRSDGGDVTGRHASDVTNRHTASRDVTQSDALGKRRVQRASMHSGSYDSSTVPGPANACMPFRSATGEAECSQNATGWPVEAEEPEPLPPTDDPKILALRARAAEIRERRAKENHEPADGFDEPSSISPDEVGPIYGEATEGQSS